MSKLSTDASISGTTLSGAQLKSELQALHAALHTAGLQESARSTITSDTTLTVTKCGLLLVDCTGGNITLTLPASGATTDDAVFIVRRLDSTTNTLSIARSGTDTIEGAATSQTVDAQGVMGLQMPAGGTDWKIFSRSGGTPAAARKAIGIGASADIASAATLDLTSRGNEIIRVTGTTAITALSMNNGQRCELVAVAALPLTYHAANMPLKGGASYTCVAGDRVVVFRDGNGDYGAEVFKKDGTPVVLTTSAAANAARALLMQLPPVRQTVLSGPIDSNGFPSFGGSTGSTTVTASGTLVPTSANGVSGDRIGSITNPSWTGLSTNGAMYLYLDIAADGSCTTGSTTLQPNEQFGGAYSTTNGQFTFNIQEMTGKVGNGSAAVQTHRVFVGEVVVAGGVVTAITWYALQGRFRSTNLSPMNAAAVVTNYNHNIGVRSDAILGGMKVFAICTTSEANYPVGAVVEPDFTVTAGGGPGKSFGITGRLTASVTGGSNGTGWQAVDRSTGAQFQMTTNRWAYYVVVNRGW